MDVLDQLGVFFTSIAGIASQPTNFLVLLGATLSGILFGALPGLTATLGVALLTSLTYGMPVDTALIALLGMYVGAIYGGSYPSILINIPGTAAAAATAMDGYPLAQRGEGGRALGLTTTASFIGTVLGLVVLAVAAPLIASLALKFTSFEFFVLAFFGITISGTLTSKDLVYKGWIAGLLGLALALIGRDSLQSFPRYTFGFSELDGGLDVVPVLIGAFGVPQIMDVLSKKLSLTKPKRVKRLLPEFGAIVKNLHHIVRSAMIGVGIGSVPGVGEDIAGWVSYGAAKNSSKNADKFGQGEPTGLISSETANNACIGGALIPLLTLGIPGSPPAAMLLGALMLHGVQPGPMLPVEHPDFLVRVTAILVLASLSMWICGMLLAPQVIKLLRVPTGIFLPIVGVLCVVGSYALGLNQFNLYLMMIVGIAAYALQQMQYPISPLVIGLILGPMADENLRRALMVSKGSLLPFFTRPVSLFFIAITVLVVLSQLPWTRSLMRTVVQSFVGLLRRGRASNPLNGDHS